MGQSPSSKDSSNASTSSSCTCSRDAQSSESPCPGRGGGAYLCVTGRKHESLCQDENAMRPPGAVTRASSRATAAWSGAKISPIEEDTASNDASSTGSASASPTSNRTSRPSSAASRVAVSISPGARSTPVTSAPLRAARSASAPVPVPTSSQRRPGRAASTRARCSWTGASCGATFSHGAELQTTLSFAFSSSNATSGSRIGGRWTLCVACAELCATATLQPATRATNAGVAERQKPTHLRLHFLGHRS